MLLGNVSISLSSDVREVLMGCVRAYGDGEGVAVGKLVIDDRLDIYGL